MTIESEDLQKALKDTGIIELCLGKDDTGDSVFVVTAIPLERHDAYKQAAYVGDAFDPASFGEIIAYGKGTPPSALMDDLKNKYGFWDGFEDRMTELGTHLASRNA